MADRIIFACTIIIAAVYLYATTKIPSLEIGDPLGPKAFPRLLGIALLLAAAMFALEMWRERGKHKEPYDFDLGVLKVLGCVTVWTACYYWAFDKAGYIVATTIFLLPLMFWFNRGKPIANVLSAVLFSCLTYWLFVTLDVNLPKGILQF